MIQSVRTANRSNNYQNSISLKKERAFRNFERWNEYINLRNQGDLIMKERFEHYLEFIGEKFNNEPDVYSTLLQNSQMFKKLTTSDRQVWRLSFLCAEISFTPEKPFHTASCDTSREEKDSFASIPSEFEEATVEEPVWTPDPNGIRLGDTVCFVDVETGEERSFLLSRQSNLENGRLNINSPVAQAILGHIQNDTVVAKTPCGDRKLQIISISRNN